MRRLLLTLPLVLAACAPETPAAPETAAGAALFATHCASCHGAEGRGDGPAAEDLGAVPADLTRIAARRDGVWPMLEVMAIVDGYARRTDARPGMPVVPEVAEGPTVEFETGNGMVQQTPANLLAIARYLETIQEPQPTRYVP
ncbi:c-type cytochrome [Roseivivax sediminis]|uniref:Cytochrome c553 n=1 Tax=Roseivivax sediminis TaxID=936889 RepID=A0A1I1X658_9RHOB|nr:cytochrome c [Roseivivax sediminis]SFE02904.1 Cytochrome c553 [Roseivivax sediminis]